MKQSYEEYRFSMTEIFKYMVQSFLLCGALDYLFYQNLWLMFLALPVTVFFLKWKKKGLIRERKKNLNYQFKRCFECVECFSTGRIFRRKCGYSMLQRLGTAVSAGSGYCAGISLHGNTVKGKRTGGRAFYEFW